MNRAAHFEAGLGFSSHYMTEFTGNPIAPLKSVNEVVWDRHLHYACTLYVHIYYL